jgi:regulator of sirC expression with transglutaminase-like and TPR domain
VEVTERFAELMARREKAVAPDEVALLIAAHARPDLDLDAEARRLDRIADGCPAPTLDGVRAHLFQDLAFRGNRAHYHDPRNSYLDHVVRRRLGIPISLAVLTIGVGRRLDVPLVGVGMPGHFLVGDLVDRDVYLDPFDGGAVLDATGCERLFRSLQGSEVPFHPSYLQPVGAHAIAARMLANLRAVFSATGSSASLVWVLRLRTLVPGVPVEERAELAAALASTGEFGAAADELGALAALTEGDEADTHARTAQRWRARLN